MRKFVKGSPVWLLLMAVLLLGSCVPQKRLRYLQHGSGNIYNDSLQAKVPVHTIAPHDLLHIQIVSVGVETSKVPGYDAGTNVGTEASVYLQGYPVAENGNLSLPALGVFQVNGMTTEALQKELTRVARQKVSLDAEVIVRLLNFRITILGEVKTPGMLEIYDQKISILDALALAGDLTTYGNRENVMLVRNCNGVKEIHYIDLTQKDLLSSPYFYLKSHDLIYVEPLDAKSYGFGQVNWGMIFSAMSTLIAILAIVIK